MNKLTTGIIVFVLILLVLFFGYKITLDKYHLNQNNYNQTGIITTGTSESGTINTGTTSTGLVTGGQNIDIESETQITGLNITGFKALGTEPFWGADFSGGNILFQNPDLGNTYISGIVGPIFSGSSLIWTGANIDMIVNIQTCSDGMSDNIYSGSISIILSGNTFDGCINL